MHTKFSKFFSGVVEASWLGAIITIPIFFNVYSSRIFEPDKATLLRIFVLIGLTAWILKMVDELFLQEDRNYADRIKLLFKTQLRNPIIIIVFSLIVIYLLSTILSITPTTSFWGSYQRSQGLITFLSYIILCILVASNARSAKQVDRIITMVILSSLPVSLYGIIQHNGLDPIPWAGNVTNRISANMGNSIFVAAYLVMVIPLTVVRIVNSLRSLIQTKGRYFPGFLLSILYILIFCTQLAAVFYSGSRGPWIGLAAGLVAVWFGLAFIWKKRALYIIGLVVLGISLVFLVLMNVKNGPLESLRVIPGIGRLGQLVDSESRTGQVRSLIWQGASSLVLPHEPLSYPDGSEDRINFLRPLIGYGPESMFVAFNRFYPPELTAVEKRNAAPDRSHNEIWDSLIFTGLIGMIALVSLFGAIIIYCLKKMGFILDRKGFVTFLMTTIGAGVIATALLVFWKGPGYFGVGLPSGMVLGVILFMIISANRERGTGVLSLPESNRELLFLGFLGAILAHAVELIFGFGITATRSYFWIFTGVILVLGESLFVSIKNDLTQNGELQGVFSGLKVPISSNQRKQNRSRERISSGKRKNLPHTSGKTQPGFIFSPWIREGVLSSILLALILVTIGFNYLSLDSGAQNFILIITGSFFNGRSVDGNNSLTFLYLTCWIVIGLVLMLEIFDSEETARPLSLLSIIYLLSITLGLVFLTWLASTLSGIVRNPSSEFTQVLTQVNRYESTFVIYILSLIMLVLCFGWFSVSNWPQKFVTLPGKIFGPILIGVMIIPAVFMNIRPIQADIGFKAADSYIRAGSWPTAIKLYSRSIDMASREDFYYLYLAKAYFEYAKTLPDEASRNQILGKAEKDMLRAQSLNSLNTDHTANLGRLFSTWSELVGDPEEQKARAQQASEYYEQAIKLSPNNSRLLGEWAFLLFSQLDQPDKAYQVIQQALAIDPNYDWLHGLLGEYYFTLAESQPEASQERQEFYLQAFNAYQKNFNLAPVGDMVSRYRVMLSMARVLSRLGNLDQAIAAYQKALEIYPTTPDKWRIHEVLARLYQQAGDREKSRLNARESLNAAPENYREQIQILIDDLEKQP